MSVSLEDVDDTAFVSLAPGEQQTFTHESMFGFLSCFIVVLNRHSCRVVRIRSRGRGCFHL